ncbi:hypothetical protein J2W97_002589 [Paenibacillus jamilae]|jgi:hypothetical protein|nr:hypothetical protein [Paenibacillus jamilae]
MNRKFFIMALIKGVFGYFLVDWGYISLIGGLVLYFTRRYESSDRLL